jgi:hypothetical protein
MVKARAFFSLPVVRSEASEAVPRGRDIRAHSQMRLPYRKGRERFVIGQANHAMEAAVVGRRDPVVYLVQVRLAGVPFQGYSLKTHRNAPIV